MLRAMKKIKLQCINCKKMNSNEYYSDRETFICKHCGIEFTIELRFVNLALIAIPFLATIMATKVAGSLDINAELMFFTTIIVLSLVYMWIRPYRMQIVN